MSLGRLNLKGRSIAAYLLVGALSGTLLFFSISLASIPSFDTVQKNYRPSDVSVFDRHHVPMATLRYSQKSRSLEWIKETEVSPTLKEFLIKNEDKRFYSHRGVDVLALGRAAWGWLRGVKSGGGSTISMQLTGYLSHSKKEARRSAIEKLQQIFWALELERTWTKNEIFEAYLNLLHFRGELIGLNAAAQGYFGKAPSGLNRQESALLVALVRSPNAEIDRVAKRACGILPTECDALTTLSGQTLSKPYDLERDRNLLPVVSPYFVESRDTLTGTIHTTLDADLQKFAVSELQQQLRSLKNHEVRDGAVLVLDTRTGQALAYVANGGPKFSSAPQVDGVQAPRQAGSTLKPFVMATAIDRNILRPESLLEDSPLDISVGGGKIYHPRNYDQVFRGMVSVSEALGSSLNVPSVKALQLVGVDAVLDKLSVLGFRNLQPPDFYGPSLALGSVDVRLWDLTQAYRNFGVDSKIFKKETKKEIFNILASAEYRRYTFGNGSLLSLPMSVAVKTGTSKDMRDNWCVGWTPEYTVGVWVGNFNGHPMRNVSGLVGAAPVWRALMKRLHPHPQRILTQYQKKSEALTQQFITRIQYPANDTLVGIDPDIPAAAQALPIEIENPQKGSWLVVNGKKWAEASPRAYFPLKRGRYKVELQTSSGEALDRVNFEIR